MNLGENHITKIDPDFLDKLLHAKTDEVLRVAMTLEPDPKSGQNLNLPLLEPSQFPSRSAYRKALIEQQQTHLAATLSTTIQELQQLSLKIYGGTTSRVILVEGTAQQILKSLELPRVNHASFDQVIKIQPPPLTNEDLKAAEYLTQIALTIFHSLSDDPNKVPSKASIHRAYVAYIENYKNRYCFLKVLGMREPVKLESVYTEVQFLDDYAIRSFEIKDLEHFYRQSNNRRFQLPDQGKHEGITVANDQQYLMVLGGPGSGKSTFLRKIGLESLKGQEGAFNHNCIPVFIELKRFTSYDINIENFIAGEFKSCEFPEPEQFTHQALERGKLLILLDGLDEVPTKNSTNVINHIQHFVDTYNKNRFIASCRTAAYRSSFNHFSNVAMADFDDQQILQFIDNWFQSAADKQAQTADRCWELLQKPENSAAKELAQTPLLLTFLCLVYDRSQNFPNNRSFLYRRALQILLEEWASEKRIYQQEIYQGLSNEIEQILLSEIAYKNFNSDRLFFSQRDVVQQIEAFSASNLNAPQNLDGEAVLNAIVVQQGILVERAENVFSFSHLTLQEYLTAKYIDDHYLVEQLVTEHLTDERWKEVFLLVAGLMDGGADNLLLLMEKEAKKYINTPKLRTLLNWAEQVTTDSAGDLKPAGKRAVAITFAIANVFANANAIAIANASAIAYAYASAIADTYASANADTYTIAIANANAIAIAIAKAIDYISTLEKLTIFNNVNFTMLIDKLNNLKTKIPDQKLPKEERQKFIQSLQQTLFSAFNLSPDMINLSLEELNAMKNFLYANDLLIQCKKVSVRVSPATWESIEARLLSINGEFQIK